MQYKERNGSHLFLEQRVYITNGCDLSHKYRKGLGITKGLDSHLIPPSFALQWGARQDKVLPAIFKGVNEGKHPTKPQSNLVFCSTASFPTQLQSEREADSLFPHPDKKFTTQNN